MLEFAEVLKDGKLFNSPLKILDKSLGVKYTHQTVEYVCAGGAAGIKLQLLHILKGTDLEALYLAGRVDVLSEDAYIAILKQCAAVIPDRVVVHRLTGDGDKKLLLAPLWSADKKHVLGRIQKEVLGLRH